MFEIIKSDLGGRIGILHTNHGKIETPAFVPVIHPVRQKISTKKIHQMGFNLVITNAYIAKKNFDEGEKTRKIHDIIDFDGAVMTDSGGYQVLEYGDVDVSFSDMAKFEQIIGSDIAIPLDKPTGFGLAKSKAKSFVDHTLKISKKTLQMSLDNGQLWVGPIQGGEHMDLVRASTKSLIDYGFQMLALGSPVEFMESYEYKLLAQMIISAKKQIPNSIPLHLFGAGHPLTIPLAVALGCDTFDSASYMLYAKHGRYITEDRTVHISKISNFSCLCDVCSEFSPKELEALNEVEKINNIALHNLFSIKSEVERVKEAIYDGRLWEYVLKKMRSHPKLFESQEVFIQNSKFFIPTTPKFKESAIFLFSKEDQFRPEIIAFHNMVRKFKSKKKTILLSGESIQRPFYLSKEYDELKNKIKNENSVQFCQVNPFLGIVPLEISDIFPAAHYVMSKTNLNPQDFSYCLETLNVFFNRNNFSTVYYDKNNEFVNFCVKKLPKGIKKVRLN